MNRSPPPPMGCQHTPLLWVFVGEMRLGVVLAQGVLDGFNATVFAYGNTGAGKVRVWAS